ncbi:MAG TPA: sulfite exporter TauE/SafE family protein [Polyangiaceae bacterium]|nr:sulfite exporter TauE/SafE family protein [Polyangiaceae bacterium]
MDPIVALAGLLVGFVVGLTGMGGGALMTPILVLLFKIEPLAAVSSDIVASMIMKPIGGGVHFKRGSVNKELVKWLVMGSIPSAFLGVVLLKHFGQGPALQHLVKNALGVALLVVASGLVIRPLLTRSRKPGDSMMPLQVKKVPTLLIGIAGGLIVGLTSVGSGSLMIILLLMLYPSFKLSELVGTDLVQAVPLVASAALGHILFGDFKLALTASILVGAIPGVFMGAQLSSRAPDYVIRPALIVVLLASASKLLGASNQVAAMAVGAAALIMIVVGLSLGARRKAAQKQLVGTGTVSESA